MTIAKSETHTHWLAALAAGAGLLPPGDVIEVAPARLYQKPGTR